MNNLDTTLNVIKEFVIKEKNLEFLAYCVRENSECHGNLENLVKEIQSFVRMKDYDEDIWYGWKLDCLICLINIIKLKD